VTTPVFFSGINSGAWRDTRPAFLVVGTYNLLDGSSSKKVASPDSPLPPHIRADFD
jgi:hypothetical protein